MPTFLPGAKAQVYKTETIPWEDLVRIIRDSVIPLPEDDDALPYPLYIILMLFSIVTVTFLIAKAAQQTIKLIKNSQWYWNLCLQCGFWPDRAERTIVYIRISHDNDIAILKLLTIPHDPKKIKLVKTARPNSLQVTSPISCLSHVKTRWTSKLMLLIDNMPVSAELPKRISIPLLLINSTKRAAVKPCDILLLFNSTSHLTFRPLGGDQEGTYFNDIGPLVTTDSNLVSVREFDFLPSILEEEIVQETALLTYVDVQGKTHVSAAKTPP